MNWLKLIAPALQVLRQGQELRNPAAWKNAQIIANVLSAVVGLLGAAGYPFGISDADVMGIAGGIVAAINIYTTIATSKKVGLPPINLIAHSEPESDFVQPIPLPPNSPIQSAPADSNADDNNGDGWNG